MHHLQFCLFCLTRRIDGDNMIRMSTVVLKKSEYEELKTRADAYDRLVFAMREDIFYPPPTRSRTKILSEFKKTGRYSRVFLASLASGLKRSSHFTS